MVATLNVQYSWETLKSCNCKYTLHLAILTKCGRYHHSVDSFCLLIRLLQQQKENWWMLWANTQNGNNWVAPFCLLTGCKYKKIYFFALLNWPLNYLTAVLSLFFQPICFELFVPPSQLYIWLCQLFKQMSDECVIYIMYRVHHTGISV